MDLVVLDVKNKSFGFNLKRLNRILRWTGFRITVSLDQEFLKDYQNNPPKTVLLLQWYRWNFIKDLKNDLPL